MQTSYAPESNRDTVLALDQLRQLGISHISVVDDSAENIQAARSLQNVIERSGLKLNLFSGVEEFRSGIKSINANPHSLVLSDFKMPCERDFFGYKNCAGMAVVDICIEAEIKGHLHYPIIISHAGKGHTGEIVEICHGNGSTHIDDFLTGKADPRFWDSALQEITQFLIEGDGKHFWRVRTVINDSEPYKPSALSDDNFKLGYFPLHVWSEEKSQRSRKDLL